MSSLPNPSPEAKAALNAGWHVSADMTFKGFRFVMVDAGAKKASAGCVAIGASALIFNAHGLIAIAYDRNAKQSSRLSSLTTTESSALVAPEKPPDHIHCKASSALSVCWNCQ
ncbi:hypothetical protein ABQ013_01400, partial [Xanthomonas citri pv. malvacearum]